MPDQGYTVTPGLAFDEHGQEVADLNNPQISTGNDQHFSNYQADIYYDESTGEQWLEDHYDPEDVDSPENMEQGDAMITEAIHDLYPYYAEMCAFAEQNWPEEKIEAFNAAIDASDWDNAMGDIEQMAEEYEQAFGSQDFRTVDDRYDPEDPYDEYSDYVDTDIMNELDLEQEDIDSTAQELMQSAPQGTAAAMEWLQAAEYGEGNPLYQDMCYATAQFHRGEMSYDQAVEILSQKYTQNEIISMAAYLMNT